MPYGFHWPFGKDETTAFDIVVLVLFLGVIGALAAWALGWL